MRGSMSEIEGALDPSRFVRVHRSAIVALDRVARLESATSGNGRALLKDGSWVPVSRSRIPEVRKLLG
jgi:two-component system LytT family response regulator